jgi:hypothetical protein
MKAWTRCPLGEIAAHQEPADVDKAQAEPSTAITLLHEMGMGFWLPKAEGELAQAGGSASAGHVG